MKRGGRQGIIKHSAGNFLAGRNYLEEFEAT